ncbi:MFS transporter [Taklimakanibacter lacteus]|uniref:MFS transporter n=1 Tax=Taklimakanibacter lacteus TaxID=2268456 RepID=UPI000E669274
MSPSVIRHARGAIALTFLVHGFVVGSWIPHIPLAKDRLDVGTGIFGVALLAIAAGAIVAMPLSGGLINRFGSARVTAVTGIAFCLAFILPPLAPDLFTFILVAIVFGATIGSMDVAMNAHGIAVEKAMRRATLSFLHAAFSIGAMVGSLLGALLLGLLDGTGHILLASIIGLVLFLPCMRFFLPTEIDRGLSGEGFVLPTRATVGLGALCFLALMGEGAVVDWSGLMLRQRFMLDAGTAALGFASFASGMSLSRLLGDRMRMKFGARRLVRWSALLMALGVAIALVVPSATIAIIALALAGIGIGNAAPVLFAGGGRLEPDAPGRGIAAVTTLGYAGFLAGPPLIGFVAELTGLTAALGLIVLASLVIAASARAAGAADAY